ncbi:MAG: HAD-IIA family hydrolase [Pigmentiphaga sp.]|uniref:HAD-IIA family hydrolase n=1 Tax=Pigmentiphaga sp. TaxID=1977564 RepID=UPI0029A63987|nr:HAD-IIA family hydrolase [Pigmentiphaga sp.]MDX3905058.1 HAD-IIA family hydrolase [Pigmentiphaga sp.]
MTAPRFPTSVGTTPAHDAQPAWLAAHDHFLLDLDGTLVRENEVMEGAAQLLDRLGSRYVVVSNNSTDTARGLARRLSRQGLRIPADRLVLAGQLTIDFLASTRPHARLQLLASRGLRDYARRLGCTLVDERPDLVVLALDKHFSFAKLNAAANAVARGATLIAANPDLYHPGPGNLRIPETGALLRAVTACSGVLPELVVGKPEKMLFAEGLRRLGARPEKTLVIGDNPATDAQGATRLGMRYLLLGSGPLADAASPAGLLALDRPGHAQLAQGAQALPQLNTA